MERYFILGDFNTYYDWNLILTAKDITPPEIKTNYVELDGASGSLDLTEALSGEPTYKDRKITATFWTDKGNRAEREKLLREITIALHGRKIKVIEPDDPTHYFIGRISIKSVKNILPYLEFSIEVTCEPWRYSIDETCRIITVSDTYVERDVVIWNEGAKTLCPNIRVIGDAEINGVKLTEGTWKIASVKLYHGANSIRITGQATVEISYREADL